MTDAVRTIRRQFTVDGHTAVLTVPLVAGKAIAVTFTDDSTPRKDPNIEAKLMAELPGILAWSVTGCLDWQRHGLGDAAAVTAATADYQAEMDVLAAWLADCCVIGKRCEARANALYRSYAEWCEQTGETPEPQRKWGMRLTERGFKRDRTTGGAHCWRGIGIMVSDPSYPSDPEMNKDLAATSWGSNNSQSRVTSVTSVTPKGNGGDTPQPGQVWADGKGWVWEPAP